MIVAENHIYARTTRPMVVSTGLSNITTAGAGTYTAAQIATGLITRDPSGASRSDTTDTAAAIIAALGLETGATFTCVLVNTADAAETITILAGASVTFGTTGTLTVAQDGEAILMFRATSATAVTLYVLQP